MTAGERPRRKPDADAAEGDGERETDPCRRRRNGKAPPPGRRRGASRDRDVIGCWRGVLVRLRRPDASKELVNVYVRQLRLADENRAIGETDDVGDVSGVRRRGDDEERSRLAKSRGETLPAGVREDVLVRRNLGAARQHVQLPILRNRLSNLVQRHAEDKAVRKPMEVLAVE